MLDWRNPQKQSAASAFKLARCGNQALVNAKKLSTACRLAFCLLLPACRQQETPKNQTAVFRLFDLFQPDDLIGKLNPDDAGWKPVEWRAQDMAAAVQRPKTEQDTNQPAVIQTTAVAF